MRVYVASGLENRLRAAAVMEFIRERGHEITYDWTSHGDVRAQGEARMREVSQREAQAVADAELVLALLPGGKGTHIELGAALATSHNKRIFVWSETGREFGGGSDTCVFYHHPAVKTLGCEFGAMLEFLKTIL